MLAYSQGVKSWHFHNAGLMLVWLWATHFESLLDADVPEFRSFVVEGPLFAPTRVLCFEEKHPRATARPIFEASFFVPAEVTV
jgi:hypothetical protein